MHLSTAIVIMAPPEAQAVAVPLLRQYSPDSLLRVPPHITVSYPFVPYDQLDEALPKLHSLCADVPPFELTVHGYDAFPGVAYMKPLNPEPVQALFQRIFAAFPEYPPYEGRFGNEIQPHLTVGEFADEHIQKAAVLPFYDPVTWLVTRVHVLYGTQQAVLPWLTYDVITLGRVSQSA